MSVCLHVPYMRFVISACLMLASCRRWPRRCGHVVEYLMATVVQQLTSHSYTSCLAHIMRSLSMFWLLKLLPLKQTTDKFIGNSPALVKSLSRPLNVTSWQAPWAVAAAAVRDGQGSKGRAGRRQDLCMAITACIVTNNNNSNSRTSHPKAGAGRHLTAKQGDSLRITLFPSLGLCQRFNNLSQRYLHQRITDWLLTKNTLIRQHFWTGLLYRFQVLLCKWLLKIDNWMITRFKYYLDREWV